MDIALGVLLGTGLAALRGRGVACIRAFRAADAPEAAGMQSALHAATSTLPHLRRGLSPRTAERTVPYLRALTGAAAIALADTRAVLAIDGEGREQVRPGDLLSRLLERTPDHRIHVVPKLVSSDPSCPLRSAVLAPLVVQGKRVGTLILFYKSMGRPSHAELRVVQEAASLVAAQVELSVVSEQEERLAQAELRALRAQISPHFIYNALAAVAGDIHARPDEARELLTDFAEFTRYLFRDGRSYVTLGEEVDHVERYLRLEQARFRDLNVTIDVPDDARATVVPAMSLQPLVENAVRHGVERRAGQRPRGDHGESDRRRHRAPDHRRRRRDRARAGVGGARRRRRRDRRLERRFAPARDVRRALRAADRIGARRGDHDGDDGAAPARRDRQP